MTPPPCAGQTSLFFSEVSDDETIAKGICSACPVVVRCAVAAFRGRERFGVWGGFTASERAGLVRVVRRRAS